MDERLDADVGFFARLREGGEPRQEQGVREERRHVQTDDAAPVAHLELLHDRLELGEYVADMFEKVRPGVGERKRPHASLEQRDAQLLLQRLDLMTHRGWRDVKFLRGRLEALQLGLRSGMS